MTFGQVKPVEVSELLLELFNKGSISIAQHHSVTEINKYLLQKHLKIFSFHL